MSTRAPASRSALVEREERISRQQLEEVVPDDPGGRDPVEIVASAVRSSVEAVARRPVTWRIILLPLEGTRSCATRSRPTARTQNGSCGWCG
jgi:hypothetical protein